MLIGNKSKDIGRSLLDLARESQSPRTILAAYVNGEIRELSYVLKSGDEIRWIDLSQADGVRIYQRSLVYLFYIALKECFADIELHVLYSLSRGLYVEFSTELDHDDYKLIENKMHELVSEAHPFVKNEINHKEAREIYNKEGLHFKTELLRYKRNEKVTLYACKQRHHYFYGYMVPDTSYINMFEVIPYSPGAILLHPRTYSPDAIPPFFEQPKIHATHMESEAWSDLMGVGEVCQLNRLIESGGVAQIIQVNEALQEKKIAKIADAIIDSKKRVVLIAGPSSSGKTTFTHRLKIQLMAEGVFSQTISLDNYFVDRDFTPLDEDGNYDFESIEALKLDLLNENIEDLLEGKEVGLPLFDFREGKRQDNAYKMKLQKDQVIIFEGIHGLNERLTPGVLKKDKFKIYISALTSLNLDQHNRIPTTDNRILRRMVRDHFTRGYGAEATLGMWDSVRRGEERHIFPFQEEADAVFNSALVYELAVIKKYALPLLEKIESNSPVYSQAKRLKKFLYYLKSIEDDRIVPSTSLLREFIGGSSIL
ncbi:MAG: nucleoside kinase [Tissierellia bacterium]|nr:nucleoside kinase [Tissierellia bacterium]